MGRLRRVFLSHNPINILNTFIETYAPLWDETSESDKRVFRVLFAFSLINFLAFSFYAKDFAVLRYLRQGALLIFLISFLSLKKNMFFIKGALTHKLSLAIKLFAFYALFNIITSIDIVNSISYFVWLVLSLIFIIACIQKLPDILHPRSFLYSTSKAFYFSGLIIVIISLIEGFVLQDHRCFDERYVSTDVGYTLQQQFGGIFGNANMLTMLILITMTSLVIIITFTHPQKSFLKKIIDYSILAGLTGLLIYIGSRSGMVCLIFATFLYIVYYKKKPVYLLILSIPVMQYIFTHPEMIATKFRTFQFEDGKVYGNREDLIEDALRITKKMDFFGVGYANQRIARAKYSVYYDEPDEQELHFHNTYLALIVELGYFGFAVFCLIIGVVLYKGITTAINAPPEKTAIIKLLLFLTAPILILGLSEDSINLPGSPVFIYFWLNFITLAYIIDKK